LEEVEVTCAKSLSEERKRRRRQRPAHIDIFTHLWRAVELHAAMAAKWLPEIGAGCLHI
jgi:hypothetical protein